VFWWLVGAVSGVLLLMRWRCWLVFLSLCVDSVDRSAYSMCGNVMAGGECCLVEVYLACR